jgi:hypothetical protein
MTESELKLGISLIEDKSNVFEQMKAMQYKIHECSRLQFQTENCKDDFDAFKQNLLIQCDKWVESQRDKLEEKFSKI